MKGEQKELVKRASNPWYTRLFSAYIFLETVVGRKRAYGM